MIALIYRLRVYPSSLIINCHRTDLIIVFDLVAFCALNIKCVCVTEVKTTRDVVWFLPES